MGCIYQITNSVTGAGYIGSASRGLLHRWQRHRKELRAGIHCNPHLQRAWDKYGSRSFELSVVEDDVPAELLLAREQVHLDAWRAGHPHPGDTYNIQLVAGSNFGRKASETTREKISARLMGRKIPKEQTARQVSTWLTNHAKWYVLLSPEGKRHRFRNIREFARRHTLDPVHLGMVLRGQVRSCKGWIRPGRPRKTFTLTSPTGEVFKNVPNLKQFAAEHGLLYKKLHAACREGRCHRGWTGEAE